MCVCVLSNLITWAKLLEEICRSEPPFLGLDSEQRTPQKGVMLLASPWPHNGSPKCTEPCPTVKRWHRWHKLIPTSAVCRGCPFYIELCGLGRIGTSVLVIVWERHRLHAFVSRAGCLAFLMSKYVLFKETNKQSKNTNSSGFSSFVLNTNKQRSVVISATTISNASCLTARGSWMVFVTTGPTGPVPTVTQ